MSTRFLTEDEILALIDAASGGLSFSESTSKRYLIGHSATTGTKVKTLSTNANCYFSSYYLYSMASKVVTETDYDKICRGTYRGSRGYINFGTIYLQWGQVSIAGNSKGTQNFMTAFYSTPYTAVCSWDNPATGSQENFGIYSLTNTAIGITNGDGSTRLFYWIAFGPASPS